tara:strand:+ start:407 stop:736 length:330 start_codon:yes stop_codon:yes gene_type:complete
MLFLSSDKRFNNSKLFFSKYELQKILSCYSIGVSRGSWKDYAINFNQNEANFFMYKHSSAAPYFILTKSIRMKKNKIVYKLQINNTKKDIFTHIDELLIILKRRQFKIF